MNKNYYFSRFALADNAAPLLFVLFSLSGILVGVFLAKTQIPLVEIFFPVLFARPSSILLLLTIVIPIVVFGLALRMRLLILVYPFAFAWAACRGFCGMLLFWAVGDGAWLFRGLLLFSSGAVSVFTCWLFLRHCNKVQMSFVRDVGLVSFLSVIVFMFDVFLISPFLFHLL